MTTFLTLLATILALLLVPILILAWATETRAERARRWHRKGLSQRVIAERLGCSRYQVRQMLAAA